ncbi:MAG: FecR family protein [Pseudomonadota bacterium]
MVIFEIALLVILMTSQDLFGVEEALGKIDQVKSQVTIQRSDGQELPAKVGVLVYPGDQITTGKEGMLSFSVREGRQFRLGEYAQLSVDELSAAEVEDGQPILRLVLGYLWSKVSKYRGKPFDLGVHTPTAVLGVRGTEFDTVVSLDGTSVITVDEGQVEVEAKDEKILLEKDQMSQVEMAAKPMPPVGAVPREKRDWPAWRKERVKRLFKNLPQMAPRFRGRFEKAVERFRDFNAKMEASSAQLNRSMENVREAKRDRDRQRFVQSVRHLREQIERFKKMIARFRGGLNRVRVMGGFSLRVETFVSRNKERFIPQELSLIQSDLKIIAQKRVELKETAQRTISTIRGTFRGLRELREEIRRERGARS